MSLLDKMKEAGDKANKSFARAQDDARKKALDQKNQRGNKLDSISLEYMGGYGDYKKAPGILTFYEKQLEFKSPLSTKFIILNSSIADVAIEGKDEVNRRVTVTRLLLVGIFAFALKKKNKDKEAYLTLELIDGQEVIFHIDKKTPMELKTKLAKSISSVKQSGRAVKNQTENVSKVSVADELGKLAELKERGIISKEEFDKEKAKILNSI